MENFKTWNIAEFPMTFEDWIKEVMEYDEGTIKSRLSNIRTLEAVFGSLIAEWHKDHFRSILERLAYSKEDERNGLVPQTGITIDGSYYNGLATYRSALRLFSVYLQAMVNMMRFPFYHLGQKVNDVMLEIVNKCKKCEKLGKKQVNEEIVEPLFKLLNEKLKDDGYSFEMEKVAGKSKGGSGTSRKDRYDIEGTSSDPDAPIIIIEIDTHRSDQIAKKVVSRVALNPDSKLLYIAVIYPNNHNKKVAEKKECEKYIAYTYTLFDLFKKPEKRFMHYLLY